MERLKQKILSEGKALSEHVLLVDSFLNHQVDPELMQAVGEEFAARFADEAVDRVVTIESSGIAPAVMTALAMKKPMVILKKSKSSILQDGVLQTEVFSFTKNAPYQLTLKTQFVHPGERVLLIDDFLANGEAALGGIRLLEKAGAKVVGVGAVIAKTFQPGMEKLRASGYRVEALAPVCRMAENVIEFERGGQTCSFRMSDASFWTWTAPSISAARSSPARWNSSRRWSLPAATSCF